MNKKKCWLGKTDTCNNSVVALNNIVPAQEVSIFLTHLLIEYRYEFDNMMLILS